MSKQELLNIVSDYSSFMESFLDEYRNECIYENEERLKNLLIDMNEDIANDRIPPSLYEKVSKLVDTLDINQLRHRIQSYSNQHNWEIYKSLSDKIIINSLFVGKIYYLLRAIGFVNSNVVLIGANGSGKTTFANSIRNHLENSENGIVIPSQKMLIFPTYSFVPIYKSAYSTYEKRQKEILDNKQTFDVGKSEDLPYDLTRKYGAEMRILVSVLLGERFVRRDNYCSTIQNGDVVNTDKFRSTLDEVIDVWNNLIEHRKLFCDDSGNLIIKYLKKDEINEYPAYKMSDGEREIFYVVGRVLLAKESSLIIVDEPESHLHKAILNKLWDTLEQKRGDCIFIYLTHDIDFASTRMAKKCWLKSYTSDMLEDWDLVPIPNDEIPEALLMKILGSRKRILFCEGKEKSLDRQIFEVLFPNYTITPVSTCKDVINYTKAFNRISKKYAEAYGIIDRDFRTSEQLESLKIENIFSYNVAEIENLFLIEDFVKDFAEYKNEPCDIAGIKEKILKLFGDEIEQQASCYVTQRINYVFNESHVKNGKKKEDVSKQFNLFTSQIQLDDWFDERVEELNEIINKEDYEKAILRFNNKGLHKIVEKSLGVFPYRNKAIEFLKTSETAKEILRRVFPSEIQAESNKN